MRVVLTTPTALEGSWQLQDAQGKVVADSKNLTGAKLVIIPYFYQSVLVQTMLRSTTHGAKGQQRKQSLRIGATSGKVAAFDTDKPAKPIVPKFDAVTPRSTRAKTDEK